MTIDLSFTLGGTDVAKRLLLTYMTDENNLWKGSYQ